MKRGGIAPGFIAPPPTTITALGLAREKSDKASDISCHGLLVR